MTRRAIRPRAWGGLAGLFLGLFLASTGWAQCVPAPDPDLNDDGIVSLADVFLVTSQFGLGLGDPGFDPIADIDCDDTITQSDVDFVVGALGQKFPVPPIGPFAYVTHAAGDQVSIVDAGRNSVLRTLDVGALPSGIAVHPAGDRVYAANSGDGSVSVIDVATAGRSTVALGSEPVGIAVNPAGTRVYVTAPNADGVFVLDASTDTLLTTVPVGSNPIDVVADDSSVYVANAGSGDVSVIDAATHTVSGTIAVGPFPMGLALTPDGTWLYVACFFDSTLAIVDLTSQWKAAEVAVGTEPRGVAVSGDGSRVYTANFGSHDVSVVDVASRSVVATIPVTGRNPTDLLLSPAGDRLYVVNASDEQLAVIDTGTQAMTDVVPVEAGHLAISGFTAEAPPEPAPSALSPIGLVVLIGLGLLVGLRRARRSVAPALALGLAVVLPGLASGQPFEFVASADVDDWSVRSFGAPSTTTVDVDLPDFPEFRRTVQNGDTSPGTDPGVGRTWHQFIAGGLYTAATLGPIESIDVSFAVKDFGAPGSPPVEVLVCVFNTRVPGFPYCTQAPLGHASTAKDTWEQVSLNGLVARDFISLLGSDATFEFSGESTDSLQFGYLVRTAHDAANPQAELGVADFSVTVQTELFGIFDGTFWQDDWELSSTRGLLSVALQEVTGGNPGARRKSIHYTEVFDETGGRVGLVDSVHRFVGAGGTYSPAIFPLSDAIIDFSLDFDITPAANPRDVTGFTLRFVSFQAGQRFVSQKLDLVSTPSDWFTSRRSYAPGDLSGAGPDFSASGAPITFGYEVTTAHNLSASNREFSVDNFEVAVGSLATSPAGGTLRFSFRSRGVLEGGNVSLEVERVLGSAGSVSVLVVPQGGTATQGFTEDYGFGPENCTELGTNDLPCRTNESWQLSWADGDATPRSFRLGTRRDSEFEGWETAQIALSAPTGGAQLDPNRSTMLIQIADDTEGAPPLKVLALALIAFFSAFEPLWLIVLGVPAVLLGARRWRLRRAH